MRETPRSVLEALTFGAMFLLVIWILWSRDGDMRAALPVLGVYAVAGLRLLPALQKLYKAAATLRSDRPALDLVHATLAAPPRPPAAARAVEPPRRSLELRDVVYAHSGAPRPSLAGVSLRIEVGTRVGIVGSTGAGKTTLVETLLGLLEPQSGAILVDGAPVRSLAPWRGAFGYSPQGAYLLNGSIAENIAFGDDAPDRASVLRAAKAAGLHGFVSSLPGGYDHPVGEKGVRLSGGQRQRIGIARALYRDPDILLLDEATSALDNLTERRVLDEIERLCPPKTLVMVAHRLSTVRSCGKIVLMEQGRVTDSGSFEELAARNAAFRAQRDAAA